MLEIYSTLHHSTVPLRFRFWNVVAFFCCSDCVAAQSGRSRDCVHRSCCLALGISFDTSSSKWQRRWRGFTMTRTTRTSQFQSLLRQKETTPLWTGESLKSAEFACMPSILALIISLPVDIARNARMGCIFRLGLFALIAFYLILPQCLISIASVHSRIVASRLPHHLNAFIGKHCLANIPILR